MNFEMTEVGAPLTDARVVALERELGIVLPETYRSFLIRYNGGRPKPHFFPIRGLDGNPFGGIQCFFGVDRPIRSNDLDWNFKIYDGRIPRELFPIAGDGSGNVICLSLKGANKNSVYFWDHDDEHSTSTYDNVYLIAETFEKFLESIYFEDINAEVEKSVRGAKVIKQPH